jgi:hypothetical protein
MATNHGDKRMISNRESFWEVDGEKLVGPVRGAVDLVRGTKHVGVNGCVRVILDVDAKELTLDIAAGMRHEEKSKECKGQFH